jgi:predicted permease
VTRYDHIMAVELDQPRSPQPPSMAASRSPISHPALNTATSVIGVECSVDTELFFEIERNGAEYLAKLDLGSGRVYP